MFLEIKGIKKHFGEGDSRIEVLKGIDMEIEKGIMRAFGAFRFWKINTVKYYWGN